MKYIPLILRILLAIPMIVFGLNKFFHFIPMEAPEPGTSAAMFMGVLFSTYLGKLVAITEVAGGLLLLHKTTSAFAAIILMPVLINILAYHLFVDGEMAGIVMGAMLTAFAIGILYFNKDRILGICGENGAA